MAWNFKAAKKEATKPTKSMDHTRTIINAARKWGIDPTTALRVAKAEGGTRGWIQSRVKKGGRQEPSYGPFQLLVGGKGTGFPEGMGNQLMRERGIDPRDPNNAEAVIDFAMEQASKHGWGQWYGAKAIGLSNRAGIGGTPSDARPMASRGRAHGTGGAALGMGVGGSSVEGGEEDMDFASVDLSPTELETMTGSEGFEGDVDPIEEEEKTLGSLLGDMDLDFSGFAPDEAMLVAQLQMGQETSANIMNSIAAGVQSQTSNAFLPRLPGFGDIAG